MKVVSKLFLIVALVGTVAMIGCDDGTQAAAGSGGSAGTGGTAGSGGTDVCAGDSCDLPEPKMACELAIEFCNSPDCCEGADPTPEQCDGFAEALCKVDFGGAGGVGGAGGGIAAEVCASCESTEPSRIAACEDAWRVCIAADLGGNEGQKCAVIALAQCTL